MSNSYQHEIPKARVNITLDLETNGAQKKKELPLKLLVLGEFSKAANASNIASREKINLSKSNLNQVMTALCPTLSLNVPNKLTSSEGDLSVQLSFNALSDFHPDQLVMQHPALKRLVAMRNLLRELKANVLDNKTLQKELEKIVKNKTTAQKMMSELRDYGVDGVIPAKS